MQVLSSRNMRFPAVVLVALGSSYVFADLGGRPESSTEVQLYRALEAQAMEQDRVKQAFAKLSRSVCGGTDDAPLGPPRRRETLVGSGMRFNTFAKCNAEASLAGYCGMFRPRTPSVWNSLTERIGYIGYLKELAARARFTPAMLGDDLEAMQYLVLDEIAARLRNTSSKPFDPHTARLQAVNSSVEPFMHNESQLAFRWNRALEKFPPAGQTWLPALQIRPSQCFQAGELPVTIRSIPPGALIHLISEFDWKLCVLALGKEPQGPECVGWAQLPAEGAMMSGRYRYQAEWPDGKSSRDTIAVEMLIGKSPVVELRPR